MKPQAWIFAGALALSSCNVSDKADRPLVDETKSASMGKIEMLKAEVRMGAGELRVGSAAAPEARAKFHYTAGALKPRFSFDNTSFRGRLTIDPSEQSVSLSGPIENKWDITLPEGLPTDVDIKLGAGEAKLELGRMDLRSVALKIGAGRVEADFRGAPKRDYEIRIEGGVGDCEIRLPREVGIRAEAKGGIGSVEVSGLTKRGDTWENAAFAEAGPKIRLDAKGGIGRIQIVVN